MTEFWKNYDNDVTPKRHERLKELLINSYLQYIPKKLQYSFLTILDSYFEDAIEYGKLVHNPKRR